MRNVLCGVCLLGVAVGLAGCSSTRQPNVVIAPSYSYVQADLTKGMNYGQVANASPTRSLSAKLPPTPAAPGFDTLVFVESDTIHNH
jgi:hypothetical protein